MWQTIKKELKNLIISGLVMLVPVAITAWVMMAAMNLFDQVLLAVIPLQYHAFCETIQFPGYGIVFGFVVLLVLGVLMRTGLGRWLVRVIEAAIKRMPLVGTVYATTHNLFSALLVRDGRDEQAVALVEYPKEGVWTFCFVTGTPPEVVEKSGVCDQTLMTVFVPTAPNPTSGVLLIVPQEKLCYLDMSSERGMRYVVSAGMSEAQIFPGKGHVHDSER